MPEFSFVTKQDFAPALGYGLALVVSPFALVFPDSALLPVAPFWGKGREGGAGDALC